MIRLSRTSRGGCVLLEPPQGAGEKHTTRRRCVRSRRGIEHGHEGLGGACRRPLQIATMNNQAQSQSAGGSCRSGTLGCSSANRLRSLKRPCAASATPSNPAIARRYPALRCGAMSLGATNA